MSRILIVEDDRDIADLIRHYLLRSGHTADVLTSGSEAIAHVAATRPDAVILDLMLPGTHRIEICRALRADRSTAQLPILTVTARAEEPDRIANLNLGADDYITKPFSPKELVARVAAVLRRSGRPAPEPGPVNYGSITLDRARHVVTESGGNVHLTAKEFLLLEYLLEHRGRVVSRDGLLSDAWGYQYTGGTRTVDVHVRRLREKLPILATALETVKQFGYRLADTPGAAARADTSKPARSH
jgi:DNA-binding response OmpR family regulator